MTEETNVADRSELTAAEVQVTRITVGWISSWLEQRAAQAAKPEAPESMDDEGPYVCPGCYAVGEEYCASWCIDAEMARDHREYEFDSDRHAADDEDD